MKKSIVCFVFICALFAACDQEPLFWDIAHEIPPIEPLIKGSPSNIVADTSDPDHPVLYVSNGDIWTWDTNSWDPIESKPDWEKMPDQPGGKVKTVAVAGSVLFSLDWNGNIKKWDGSTWSDIGGIAGIPEKIYGAGNYLFAGSLTGAAGSLDGYCILAMAASDNSMTEIKSDICLLSGAAELNGAYYLGTMGDDYVSRKKGNGIYKTQNPNAGLGMPDYGESVSIIGLIKHGNIIVAITDSGKIIYDEGSGFVDFNSYSNTPLFSGALSSWENENGGKDRILLIGLNRSSSSYGYGYRELLWRSKDSFTDDKVLYIPGEQREPRENYISSVKQDYQYTSGISNHVVVSLYALPPSFTADDNKRPIVYASTLKDGLWAYRVRRGDAQWNGEDNSN
jgi:hypothetical protein